MKNYEKGSVLIFSLIIVMFMVIVSIGMASAVLTGVRSSSSTAKTTQSFQYADTGAERILIDYKEADQDARLDASVASGGLGASCDANGAFIGNIATDRYKIQFLDESGNVMDCTDLVMDVRKIKSTGSYLGNARAIEVSVPCTSPYGPETDVVGLWHLEENANPFVDDSTLGNNATMSGTSQANGICNARSFNGTSDYVRLNNDLAVTNDFTVEAWINPSVIGPAGTRRTIVSAGESKPSGFVFDLDETSPNRLRIWVHTGAWQGCTGTVTSFVANQWYHVAATRDGDETMIYVNGVKDIASCNLAGNMTDPTSTVTTIGARNSMNTFYFRGIIDEVRIFDSERNDSQIESDFCNGCNRLTPTPAGCGSCP